MAQSALTWFASPPYRGYIISMTSWPFSFYNLATNSRMRQVELPAWILNASILLNHRLDIQDFFTHLEVFYFTIIKDFWKQPKPFFSPDHYRGSCPVLDAKTTQVKQNSSRYRKRMELAGPITFNSPDEDQAAVIRKQTALTQGEKLIPLRSSRFFLCFLADFSSRSCSWTAPPVPMSNSALISKQSQRLPL